MDQRGKRLLTIAAIVILLFLGVTSYFIFFTKKPDTTNSVSINNSLVPFDEKQLTETNGIVTIGGETENPTFTTDVNPVSSNSRERLRKITSFPVSGFVSFLLKTNRVDVVIDEKTGKEKQVITPVTTHHIRYNDQRNGHIFDGIVDDSSILNSKITKTDLPSAEELIFNSTGTAGFLRYEKNNQIETFKLTIPGDKKITIPQICTTPLTTDLKVTSKGSEVKILQDYLNYKFNQKLTLDGVFGQKTASSIKTIQKDANIPQTGVVDQATRDVLSKECITIQQEAIAASSSEPKELKGSLVPGYITQMVHNLQTNDFFSLELVKNKTTGSLLSTDLNQSSVVFNSSFNEWMPQYSNKNLITMTTYASAGIDGYMYGLNPTTKTFSKLLGPIQGLTTLTNPSGTYSLISTSGQNGLTFGLTNLSNGQTLSVPFKTLPEKCAWYSDDVFYCGVVTLFPNATYPDDWYKGLVTLSDTLWSYTISTKEARQLATPTQAIDIVKMKAFPDTEYLFFINNINNELWSYRIGGED